MYPSHTPPSSSSSQVSDVTRFPALSLRQRANLDLPKDRGHTDRVCATNDSPLRNCASTPDRRHSFQGEGGLSKGSNNISKDVPPMTNTARKPRLQTKLRGLRKLCHTPID